MLSHTQFVILLRSVPQIGEKALARLLRLVAQRRLGPEEFLALSPAEWRERYELDPRAAAYLTEHREALLAASVETLRLMAASGLKVVTLDGAAYPRRLDLYDDAPPPVLFACGELARLAPAGQGPPMRFTFTLAVSNGASPVTLSCLDETAATLARMGGVPVTGHDRAPYQRLALAAQRDGLPTVYILDRGLREAMGPALDRPLFPAARIRDAAFDARRDLALSPFRLDDHAVGANNRRRDRLVHALADIIVALDVRAGGALMEECRRARQQSRPVLVAPGGRDGNEALRDAGCLPLPQEPAARTDLVAGLVAGLRAE